MMITTVKRWVGLTRFADASVTLVIELALSCQLFVFSCQSNNDLSHIFDHHNPGIHQHTDNNYDVWLLIKDG